MPETDDSIPASNRSWIGPLTFFAAGAVLVVITSRADVPFSTWVYDREIGMAVKRFRVLTPILKAPGNYLFTLCVAVVVGLFSARRWLGAGLVAGSGIVSGLLYVVVKWSIGRTRPFKGVPPFEFHPFRNGLHGLIKAENQAFPSGHACLAFATAEALAMVLPRWRPAFYAGATVVGLERIFEGAHYPADAVAGALFGILSARLTGLLLTGLRSRDSSSRASGVASSQVTSAHTNIPG